MIGSVYDCMVMEFGRDASAATVTWDYRTKGRLSTRVHYVIGFASISLPRTRFTAAADKDTAHGAHAEKCRPKWQQWRSPTSRGPRSFHRDRKSSRRPLSHEPSRVFRACRALVAVAVGKRTTVSVTRSLSLPALLSCKGLGTRAGRHDATRRRELLLELSFPNSKIPECGYFCHFEDDFLKSGIF